MYLIHSPILSNNQISSTNGDDTFNAAHTILKGHYFCNQKDIDYLDFIDWYKNALKCCSAARLPNLLCTYSTDCVKFWSGPKKKYNPIFPQEMKNKISIVLHTFL